MDYLQELGRRQQALLARLLLGTGRQEATEEAMDTAEAIAGDEQTWALSGTAPGLRFFEGETAEERTAALEEQAETVFLTRQADALWREAPQAAASRPGALMTTAREAGDAEAFSRAVQRDARRYDGGFTMF